MIAPAAANLRKSRENIAESPFGADLAWWARAVPARRAPSTKRSRKCAAPCLCCSLWGFCDSAFRLRARAFPIDMESIVCGEITRIGALTFDARESARSVDDDPFRFLWLPAPGPGPIVRKGGSPAGHLVDLARPRHRGPISGPKTTVSAKHFVINRLASRNGNIAKHIGF
jgi:hypothetical protein